VNEKKNKNSGNKKIFQIPSSFSSKRINGGIRSVSTNVSSNSSEKIENKKKITIIPKIKLNKKDNDNSKEIVLKPKKNNLQNIHPLKIDYKSKFKVARTIVPYKLNDLENASCPICGKTINNMSNAIHDKINSEMFHFECVTTELKKTHTARQNQRLVYVGSNQFAIIEDFHEEGKTKFRIIEKIQFLYEKK
jgi:hypothetical protein